MRVAWLVGAALALAGCLGAAPPAASPPPAVETPAPHGSGGNASDETHAPDLRVGTAWTYRASGEWETEPSFTVVVAKRSSRDYLFAAARAEDLPGQVAWGRPWFGWRDAELNALPSEHPQDVDRLFDFPLHDGKSWSTSAGTAVASAADVPTPRGPLPGFVIAVRSGDVHAEWSFVPAIGFLAHYRLAFGERIVSDVAIESVGEREDWHWYERKVGLDLEGTTTGVLHVPADADAVVGSVGGHGSAAVVIQPPDGREPWVFRADAERVNVGFVLDAAPGPWSVSTAAASEGSAYARPVAVNWIHSA